MPERAIVPIRLVNGEKWGDLNSISLSHDICGEKVDRINDSFSFAGGHRVRLYRFRKNVHWRIPKDVTLDITSVEPAAAPRKLRR
jgi:hypothetical protein